MYLTAKPAKQLLAHFALNFMGRMHFSPALSTLVWKWIFSSSREWRFCWRNNSRLMVGTVWSSPGLHSAQQERQNCSVHSLITMC